MSAFRLSDLLEQRFKLLLLVSVVGLFHSVGKNLAYVSHGSHLSAGLMSGSVLPTMRGSVLTMCCSFSGGCRHFGRT